MPAGSVIGAGIYRSGQRRHPVPVLLVFALINRPDIFDLRPGHSFVEHLLADGFDVYLLDWGVPGPEDADTGLDHYVCDALPWAMREVLRASGAPGGLARRLVHWRDPVCVARRAGPR